MSEIDWAPVTQALIGLASAIITVAVPIVTSALLKRFAVASGADQAAQLDTALKSVASDAYRVAVITGKNISSKEGQNAVVQTALIDYMARTPNFNAIFGPVSAKDLHDKVLARLGALMAADPNISAGPTPTAL
jgi:hypothetical protein